MKKSRTKSICANHQDLLTLKNHIRSAKSSEPSMAFGNLQEPGFSALIAISKNATSPKAPLMETFTYFTRTARFWPSSSVSMIYSLPAVILKKFSGSPKNYRQNSK
jgi:hypothetical protein